MSILTKTLALYSKEELEGLLNESHSIKEFITKIGITKLGGGSYQTIKKYFNKIGINYKEFTEKSKLYGITVKRGHTDPIPLNDILVEGSNYNRCHLKRRIINNNLIKYECAICGNKGEWRGKELVLRLDHINGINNDNRIENLRFVCPNCDSQLDTFCGKNKKSYGKQKKPRRIIPKPKKYCSKCGKPIGQNNKHNMCISCFNELKSSHIPSKEQIYLDIISLPFLQIGKKYGVSDNAVRKWCRKYNLPFRKKDIKNCADMMK